MRERFRGVYARVRAIALGRDGRLWGSGSLTESIRGDIYRKML